jgi:hypothetical protein
MRVNGGPAGSALLACVSSLALVACGSSPSAPAAPTDAGSSDAAPGEDATTIDSSTGGPDASLDCFCDDASSGGPIGDDGSVSPDAPPDAPPPPTILITGWAVGSPTGGVIEASAVCPYNAPTLPCNSATGTEFSLRLPANALTGLTLDAPPRDSVLVPIETGGAAESGWEIGMSTQAAMSTIFSALGATYPSSTTGFLTAYAEETSGKAGMPGVVVSIEPASGLGPIYTNSAGAPAPSATATSSTGAAYFGNVAPGLVRVTWVSADPSARLYCYPVFGGWPTLLGSSVLVPIAQGYDTHVAVACEHVASTLDAGTAGVDGGDGGEGDAGSADASDDSSG